MPSAFIVSGPFRANAVGPGRQETGNTVFAGYQKSREYLLSKLTNIHGFRLGVALYSPAFMDSTISIFFSFRAMTRSTRAEKARVSRAASTKLRG